MPLCLAVLSAALTTFRGAALFGGSGGILKEEKVGKEDSKKKPRLANKYVAVCTLCHRIPDEIDADNSKTLSEDEVRAHLMKNLDMLKVREGKEKLMSRVTADA